MGSAIFFILGVNVVGSNVLYYVCKDYMYMYT